MNFDEAMQKAKTHIGVNYRVSKVETCAYGWMFHYDGIDWEHQETIGGGPIFIDVFGETFQVAGFLSPNLFHKNWELSHPDYEIFGERTVLSEGDESAITRIVNTILMHAIKDKATEINLNSQTNFFGLQVSYLVDSQWREQMKIPYYALIAQRFKQMADIPPRDKYHPNATQNETIKITMKDERCDVVVTETITEGGEHLNLRLKSVETSTRFITGLAATIDL